MSSSSPNDISELIIRQYLAELNSNPPPDNNRKSELGRLIAQERDRMERERELKDQRAAQERELKSQRDHSEKIWKTVLNHIFGNNSSKNVKIKNPLFH